jgi:hypothetical protein
MIVRWLDRTVEGKGWQRSWPESNTPCPRALWNTFWKRIVLEDASCLEATT